MLVLQSFVYQDQGVHDIFFVSLRFSLTTSGLYSLDNVKVAYVVDIKLFFYGLILL